MAPSRPVLTHADTAAVLAACPVDRPQGLSLTDFHSWLTDTLAQVSRPLAKKVLRLDRDQLLILARMLDLIGNLTDPGRAAHRAALVAPADWDAGTSPTRLVDFLGSDNTQAAPLTSNVTNSRPSRRPPRAGTRLSCRLLSACPGRDLTASLVDVSPMGVGIIVGESLSEGQQLSLVLQGPGDGPPTRRVGNVRWWRATPSGHYRVGVMLEDGLRPAEFEAIAVTEESLSGVGCAGA